MTNLRKHTKNAPHVNPCMLLINKSVLLKITNNAEGKIGEVGGTLLGLRRQQHIHIKSATLPSFYDSSERYLFCRRDWSHQIVATRQWFQSGFKVDWIGEWHSHPEACPRPSSIDIASWRKQVNQRQIPMVYIILGLNTNWIGRMDMGCKSPKVLKQIEEKPQTLLLG